MQTVWTFLVYFWLLLVFVSPQTPFAYVRDDPRFSGTILSHEHCNSDSQRQFTIASSVWQQLDANNPGCD